MATEVRSPWSSSGNTERSASRPIGVGPGGARADQGGHLLRHVGKGGMTNSKLMAEPVPRPTPVVGRAPGPSVTPDSRRR